jgi:hypothetical protein
MADDGEPVQTGVKDLDVVGTGIPNVTKVLAQVGKSNSVDVVEPIPINEYFCLRLKVLAQDESMKFNSVLCVQAGGTGLAAARSVLKGISGSDLESRFRRSAMSARKRAHSFGDK